MTKAQAEALLATIDSSSLRDTLETVLRSLLGDAAGSSWSSVIQAAGLSGGWSRSRTEALLAEEQRALEQLAVDLSELRQIPTG